MNLNRSTSRIDGFKKTSGALPVPKAPSAPKVPFGSMGVTGAFTAQTGIKNQQNKSAKSNIRSVDEIRTLQNKLKNLKSTSPNPRIANKKSSFKRTWNRNPYQSTKQKEQKRGFHWLDYSLSFMLLFISIGLGFNLTFQFNNQFANAGGPTEIAGVREEAGDINQEFSNQEQTITQEEFEAWMLEHYPQSAETTQAPQENVETVPTAPILAVFGTETLSEINNISVDRAELTDTITTAQQKDQYIQLAQKIDNYIATYRSYEAYDNQLETPLNGMTYIAVAEETGIPLKFLMAISRAESRFGTDRFTNSGFLTRPGEYLNPCSIGLDDEGGNIGFESFEEGLRACGNWYKYFEEKGVPDCRKWGIFNPNGDYCGKITDLSNQIEAYLAQ